MSSRVVYAVKFQNFRKGFECPTVNSNIAVLWYNTTRQLRYIVNASIYYNRAFIASPYQSILIPPSVHVCGEYLLDFMAIVLEYSFTVVVEIWVKNLTKSTFVLN